MRLARADSTVADIADSPAAAEGVSVELRDVVKTFGTVRALAGVSFSMPGGGFVTIEGPSGSGKSTLLSLIGTIDQPTSGTILVDGVPIPKPRDAVQFRRHVVGFVFQDNLLMPYLTAQGNVETPLLATGLHHQSRQRRARQLLEEVGLTGRAEHLPSQLSGGERQRVAIARALANQPRLVLADEPTGALDSSDSERILDLLASIRERHETTVIIVSHDPAVTARADEKLRLVDGLLR